MSDAFDTEEQRLLSHLYQIIYGDLGMCGCGYPDEAITAVHELLTAFSWGFDDGMWQRKEAVISRQLPTPAAEHLVLSMLDNAKLTEHGTSIGGSWLTDRGKWTLWAVQQVGGVDNLDERLCQVGYPHLDGGCTEACWNIPDGWTPAGPEPVVPTVTEQPAACVRCLYGTPHQHAEALV